LLHICDKFNKSHFANLPKASATLALNGSSKPFLSFLSPIAESYFKSFNFFQQMSLFGADFLRNANRLLYVHGKSNPDVQVQI